VRDTDRVRTSQRNDPHRRGCAFPCPPQERRRSLAMIQFACPRCQLILECQNHGAGSKVVCPKCQQRLQIPAPPRDKTVLAPLFAYEPAPPPSPPAALGSDTLQVPKGAIITTKPRGAGRISTWGVFAALGVAAALALFVVVLVNLITRAANRRSVGAVAEER